MQQATIKINIATDSYTYYLPKTVFTINCHANIIYVRVRGCITTRFTLFTPLHAGSVTTPTNNYYLTAIIVAASGMIISTGEGGCLLIHLGRD